MNVVIFYISALFVGSFMNDVIDYVLAKEQKNKEISKCEYCNHPLRWYDKLPVVSYLLTLGKCRYCKRSLSLRYPIVELGAVANFLIVYRIYEEDMQALYFFIYLCLMIILMVIDLVLKKIPIKLLLIIIGLGIASMFTSTQIVLLDRICAVFIVSVPLIILSKIKKHSIGTGDILYCACAGLLLGMWGIVCSTSVAYLLAGVYSMYMLFKGKLNKQSKVAMFPFFYIGLIIYLLYAVNFIQITLR